MRIHFHAATAAAAAAVLAAIAFVTLPAAAADWPTKPVRIVYNYPAGTGGDVVLRTIAEPLGKVLGQPVIVENRAGASGAVGVESVGRMAPDGYTFLASPNAPMVLVPLIRKITYEPKDFRPIAAIGEYIYGVSVLPNLGVKSIAELVALAKSKPGILTYSSPGAGSATNLRGETFNLIAGTQITHVPYRGGPEALTDFLGGNVIIMIDNAQFPMVRTGKAINLAVTTDRRHPDFPDVPSLKEAGFDMGLATFLALYAQKGVADDVALKMGSATAEIVSRPEIRRRLLDIGFFAMEETPEQVVELNTKSAASFAKWVKETNFKID
ncbi:MAG: tripartite tricarboxylate transporter substrate binding protein [Proteobacteria bacterium]|nr:tripartite tricarboxylate transporter substrate binding protein [Pseudomonadota bacterium]